MPHPLIKKLYLTKKPSRLLYNQSQYSPELLEIDNIALEPLAGQSYHAIFAHVYDLSEMADLISQISQAELIKEEGQVFFVYPKLANKLGMTGIHRDSIFPTLQVSEETGYMGDTDFKFNRMVSLNDNFTIVGLKYLPQKASQPKSKAGQVSTYSHRIPELRADLPLELQATFDNLTPGRQRDWARRIYSAKREATIAKRWQDLLLFLQEEKRTD